MKRAIINVSLVLGLAMSVGIVGCTKKPVGITPIPGSKMPVRNVDDRNPPISPGTPLNPGGTDVVPKPIDTTPTPMPNPDDIFPNMVTDRLIFQANTVYFEFDRATVRKGEQAKIDEVAAHLKANAANKMLIEGHCDERGTEEYNRALGERRALAVREYLLRSGIAPERMITKTLGKDRPAVEGHTDAAWSKNRRGEFILLKPKP